MIREPKNQHNFQMSTKKTKHEPTFKSTFMISNAPIPEKILKTVKRDKIEEEDLDRIRVDGSDRQLLKRQKSVWNSKRKIFKKVLVDEND